MTEMSARSPVEGPLSGLRIVELGHFVAAPFCTRVLADLGAEIIKVEPPGRGDPVRTWGEMVDGKSLWWSVHGRNKKSVTLNLKHPKGVDLAKRLIESADGVVENFKPGQLERWGLGPKVIDSINPGCTLVRISGYGQTGPYKDRAAFGVIGEAMGGLRHLTAFPADQSDLPPARTGVSLGDMVTGLYAAIGLLSALFEKQMRNGSANKGRVVDVALTESVFTLLEGCLPEYGKLGRVRQPTGSTLPTNAPSNAYPCRDGKWVVIAANSDALFTKMMALIERNDLADDPRFKDNPGRVRDARELDGAITAWTLTQDGAEASKVVQAAGIPATEIYTIEDCVNDQQFQDRDMVQTIHDPSLGEVLHPGIVPRFDSDGPAGGIGWAGPQVGEHNSEVYGGVLGLSSDALAALKKEAVI